MTPALAVGIFVAFTTQPAPPVDQEPARIQLLKVEAKALRVEDFPTPRRIPSLKRLAVEFTAFGLADWVSIEVALASPHVYEHNKLAQTPFRRGALTALYVASSALLVREAYKADHTRHRIWARIIRGLLLGLKVYGTFRNVWLAATNGGFPRAGGAR